MRGRMQTIEGLSVDVVSGAVVDSPPAWPSVIGQHDECRDELETDAFFPQGNLVPVLDSALCGPNGL